jgi:polyphosphate kinase 2 (PPK2 family)
MAQKARKLRLADVDLSRKLPTDVYLTKLDKLQKKLAQIQQAYLFSDQSAVVVFEGWDAAGKGGTIRRVSMAMDPRSFKVWPIGAPRKYYLARHYFLRFMERLPPTGAITVFDRSWYGRVLVERVEELTPVNRWKAGFREINEFERMITEDGTRLVKLFFHISPEEQLQRFHARLHDPMKRWKLTYDDFRNRGRWDDYVVAIEEMLAKTSTSNAPWCVVPANDKRYARITAMTEIVKHLGRGVDLRAPTLDHSVVAEAQAHFELEQDVIDKITGRKK